MRLRQACERVQTGADLQQARARLRLSLGDLAFLLRMNGANATRHLREMEAGTREVGGPLAAAVGLMLEIEEAN